MTHKSNHRAATNPAITTRCYAEGELRRFVERNRSGFPCQQRLIDSARLFRYNNRAVPTIPLITKIRIVALIIAAFLLVGGCKAALHPKLRLVGMSQTAQVESQPRPTYSVELVTSQNSRVFGILRMLIGAGLGLYVLLPWLDLKNKVSRYR